jgi:hypothetical protein
MAIANKVPLQDRRLTPFNARIPLLDVYPSRKSGKEVLIQDLAPSAKSKV